ncbi:hypothetical protein K1719_017506 [Acacia pycnantha]|nr:hypothetical protein K1719_017506 [Acacia pycnantha]
MRNCPQDPLAQCLLLVLGDKFSRFSRKDAFHKTIWACSGCTSDKCGDRYTMWHQRRRPINFEKIQLSTVYIDDFVQIGEEMKEALQVDSTHYALGIEIIGVHVTKPSIPDSISRNLEQLEEERTKVLIAVERQKESSKRQQEIENQMYLQREKYRVDANFYRATKEAEAEANKLKLAEYLKLKYIEAIVEIAKRSSYLVKLLQYLQLFARYFFH